MKQMDSYGSKCMAVKRRIAIANYTYRMQGTKNDNCISCILILPVLLIRTAMFGNVCKYISCEQKIARKLRTRWIFLGAPVTIDRHFKRIARKEIRTNSGVQAPLIGKCFTFGASICAAQGEWSPLDRALKLFPINTSVFPRDRCVPLNCAVASRVGCRV